jgi:curved DNA-binding protein CbpA
MEEAQQAERDAEEARLEADARQAEEARLAEELRQAAEAREAAEAARWQGISRSDEAPSAPDPFLDEDSLRSEERRLAKEARLAEKARKAAQTVAPAASISEFSWSDAIPSAETHEPLSSENKDALRLARQRAEAALLQDMEEAKRRAVAPPVDSWLAEESPRAPGAEQAAPQPVLLEREEQVDLDQDTWSDLLPYAEPSASTPQAPEPPPPAPEPVAPASLEPSPLASPPPPPEVVTRSPSEDDLWRIVTFDEAEIASNLSDSFEAALNKVESHLEALVQPDTVQAGGNVGEAPEGLQPQATPAPVSASSAFPTPPGDKAAATGQTAWNTSSSSTEEEDLDGLDGLDDWDFDEDDVAGDPSNPDEAARQRRQRLLRRAMENMGALGFRPEAPVGAVSVSAEAEPPAAPTEAAPSEPPPPAAEDAGLMQQIEKRYAELQSKRDHFVILGVTPETPRDQVKAAFLSLAKVFHPDRLPPSLPHLAPKMTAVFEAIREAYEILYDEAKRNAYLEGLKKAAAPKPPATASAPGMSPAGRGTSGNNPGDLFKMGEVFFRKRDFAAAVDHFERAHALEPKALYLAAQGWALYMDPQRKAEVSRAKQLMAEALKLDPNCDRAHYQLGVIARVEGDTDRAERHFREAVRANPKHLEANQELRLIEMRKKNTPTPKKGFFR